MQARILPPRRRQRGFFQINPFSAFGSSGTDPYYSSVSFLSHLNEDNGIGQIVPEKYLGGNLGLLTGASISSAQSVFGGKSLRCVTTAGGTYTSQGVAMGAGDFTMEGWVRFDSVTAISQVIWDLRPSSTSGVYPLLIAVNNELRWSINTVTRISATGAVAANTWYFVAVSRVSGSTRMYLGTVGGTASQVGSTYSDSNNYLNGDFGLGTGAFGSAHLGGYIDDTRFTTGVGRYAGTSFPVPLYQFPNS